MLKWEINPLGTAGSAIEYCNTVKRLNKESVPLLFYAFFVFYLLREGNKILVTHGIGELE